MSYITIALFACVLIIFIFQIYGSIISFRNNKVDQKDLNYTGISLTMLIFIPSLGKNHILSIIVATISVLIMVRLIFSFIYFTYFSSARIKK